MDWTWLPPITLIGSLLLFATSVWKLLLEHSAIRRMERLAEIREKVATSPEIVGPLDRALVALGNRVARREMPKESLLGITIAATLLGLAASVGSVVVILLGSNGSEMNMNITSTGLASLSALLGGAVLSVAAAVVRKRKAEDDEEALTKLLVGMQIHERRARERDQAASA